MKKIALVVTLIAALAALTACQTATILTSSLVASVGCELTKQKPAAAGPLLGGGKVFLMFSQTTVPSEAQLREALAAVPLPELEAVHIRAMWEVIAVAYRAVLKSAKTPEKLAEIRFVLGSLGEALIEASQCKPPEVTAEALTRAASAYPVTWDNLAQLIANDLKKGRLSVPAKK